MTILHRIAVLVITNTPYFEGKETTKSFKYPIKFAKLVHKSFVRAIDNAEDRFTESQ